MPRPLMGRSRGARCRQPALSLRNAGSTLAPVRVVGAAPVQRAEGCDALFAPLDTPSDREVA